MTALVITIDGPAGSGKSTIAQLLGDALKLPCIDTGAMYRYVAHLALEARADLKSATALEPLASSCEFSLKGSGSQTELQVAGGQSLSKGPLHDRIRSSEVSMAASDVAVVPELREVLVKKQRQLAEVAGGILNGRDAGTVICPEAPVKFFLTASAEVRARRRHLELQERETRGGAKAPEFHEVLSEVEKRDQQDQGRKVGPLRPAEDSIMVDSSALDIPQVVDLMVKSVHERVPKIQG